MAEATIDPSGDGSPLQWTPTPGGTHYTCLDDGDRDPTVPDTSDYITGDGVESDTMTLTLPNVDEVSQVVIKSYGNDQMGGCGLRVSNNGSDWTSQDTLNMGAGSAWDTSTWSALGWNIGGTLTLYAQYNFLGGSSFTLYSFYAVVTYTEQAGGGGSPTTTIVIT